MTTPHEKTRLPDKARLYWQCRRGMLELDCLLQDFFKDHYDNLPIELKGSFETLLSYEDDILLEYLLGRTVPADAHVAHVVQHIRKVHTA